jgi:hypothetical protein
VGPATKSAHSAWVLCFLLATGCAMDVGDSPTASPSAPPTAAGVPTADATPPPTADATPAPPSATAQPTAIAEPTVEPPPQLPAELVWFAPNMGSTDHAELFTDPGAWAGERELIDVFQFHSAVLFDQPCAICSDNSIVTLGAADSFRQLSEWGIATAVEVGAIYEDGCDGAANFARDAGVVIANVAAHGGSVRLLTMDEPLLHGGRKPHPLACDYTPAEAAVETAAFVRAVAAAHPDILVGLVEPYPHYSVVELQDWILELDRQGVALPFFHLDVDIERVRVEGQRVAADLRALRDFCQARDIAFGVIFTSNWTRSGSNRAYYRSTLDWVTTVNEAMGRPQHVKFESWQGPASSGHHEVPVNLTRNDPDGYGHLALLREGLNVLAAPQR